MPVLKRIHRAQLLIFCIALCGAGLLCAQTPTIWWPDPSSGLMWTGSANYSGLNWQQATSYCAALNLADYQDWRLPTQEEVDAILYDQTVLSNNDLPDHQWELRGQIWRPYLIGTIWTSTLSEDQKARTVEHGVMTSSSPDNTTLLTDHAEAHCVREMGADLLEVAKQAKIGIPVSDLMTLRADVPLNIAHRAYQSGEYQQSLTQSQYALLIKPDMKQAYWCAGISSGMLGQWDLAISNLKSALALDKNYEDAILALKWAKDGQKASQKAKVQRTAAPAWIWDPELKPCVLVWIDKNASCIS